MPTLAIVGAGSGLGLSIARSFGQRGFTVALIARTPAKLEALVSQLAEEGITAAAFPADLLDRDSLVSALDAAKEHFGGIDVLEYSPAPHATPVPGLELVPPSAVTPGNLQVLIEYAVYGAIVAAQAVLPAMRAAGSGTLLFTGGGGAVDPVPMFGNVNAAQAALRNWVLNLSKELAGSGVHAAHVAIDVWLGDHGSEGAVTATPDQVAPVYWELHETHDRSDVVFRG